MNTVHLIVWSGEVEQARALVAARFPAGSCNLIPKREFRESGWKGQVRTLRSLRGEALVFFFKDLAELHEVQLLASSIVLHRCRATVLMDAGGAFESYDLKRWLRSLPQVAISAFCDATVFATWWVRLRIMQRRVRPVDVSPQTAGLDIAYIFPYTQDKAIAGGAMSHVGGFLGGLAEQQAACLVFSGTTLPAGSYRAVPVANRGRSFLFREARALSYNSIFVNAVAAKLGPGGARAIYQRHGRFSVAGAMLSQRLHIPLVLEYNSSEVWTIDYWDPARFCGWLRLCEDVLLSASSLVVVVSEPLRDELIQRGIAPDRILVNTNGVDPEKFHPDCGGADVRRRLGFGDDDVVVVFVGTFSYWHGVQVLQQAISALCADPAAHPRLRFLLIGDGPLAAESREQLEPEIRSGKVVFAGLVRHDEVPPWLDAGDIFVSPHIPMPDGSRFFGSPTKLFEYMAMGKAIVASALDQLAIVLQHDKTAWLVTPGSAAELAAGIALLSRDCNLRTRLGVNARAAAVQRHTWRQNAGRVLAQMSESQRPPEHRGVAAADAVLK